ncbi:sugar transferase [Micromonospora zhanjiangensis]|uniref:Sugar transferase n=1 Tax=Micromonospora zhanjiangensis TaxID=1522057 RepID=A0ABV8KII5_9ACTN
MPSHAFTRTIKRAVDIGVASALLVVALPALLPAMAFVRISLGAPVFFKQERTGYAMRRFLIYKLRTMGPDRAPDGRQLPDGERCGRAGRFLRRWSIDELPQLVNILRGDLSLVGPRPLLPRYDPWYTPAELARFTVRPGITGLAQINGRNHLPWNERLALDVRYVDEQSLWLDLRILARTARAALLGSGVASDPSALMLDLDEERAPAWHR